MNDVVISIKNLGIRYKKRGSLVRGKKTQYYWALRGVNLEIKKGEVLGVIGVNGAGKSTLLKAMNQIIKPDEGEVINRGYSTALLSISAGFIGYLSGRENAILNGLLLGMSKGDITEKIEDIKALSEIGDFFEQPIYTYSSGMKSRLGFSVAYYTDPDVILVDEVISVGDRSFKEKFLRLMKERIKSDKTVVVVSYSMSLIKDLCICVVVIDKKGIVDRLSVEEAIAKYNKL